jgi:hypothetical protein
MARPLFLARTQVQWDGFSKSKAQPGLDLLLYVIKSRLVTDCPLKTEYYLLFLPSGAKKAIG